MSLWGAGGGGVGECGKHGQVPSSHCHPQWAPGPQEHYLLIEMLNPEPAHIRPWQPSATLQADQLALPPERCPCVGGSRDPQAEE